MWNSRLFRRGFAAVCLIAGSAAAEDAPAPPKPDPEAIAVQAWGGAHPDCAEWTDTCTICLRGRDAIACSTPGVACLPQPIVCRRPVAPEPAPEPPPAPTPLPSPETKP